MVFGVTEAENCCGIVGFGNFLPGVVSGIWWFWCFDFVSVCWLVVWLIVFSGTS